MSQYGRAYICINVERELQLQSTDLNDDSIEGLRWMFGMHMAFDPEASEKLNCAVTDFGWSSRSTSTPQTITGSN